MKILRAWWNNSDEIVVVLDKDVPEIPKISLSGACSSSKVLVSRASKEFFSYFTSFYVEDGIINFVLGENIFPDVSADSEYYLCGDFNGWGAAIGVEKWKAVCVGSKRMVSVPIADLNLKKKFGFFKFASADGAWMEPRSAAPNIVRDKDGNMNLRFLLERTGKNLFVIKCSDVCALGEGMVLTLPEYGVSARVEIGELLCRTYSGERLGVFKKHGGTEFSIFAPRAKAAAVRWWRKGGVEHILEASSSDGAVWTAASDGDLDGAFYSWHIDGNNLDSGANFDKRFPIADPYANAMAAPGGPCIVKYRDELPEHAGGFRAPYWHDLVIMEAHVRDVLAHARADLSPKERLTFEGLAKWLKSDECYLRKAGVNCVELQPILEYEAERPEDYEWGYMPTNWFSPASSYATDAEKGTQNKDFAGLVEAFHEAGIAVVLDVVYNHYGEPNSLLYVDKEYYFELAPDGSLMNYSGCGNDFRADTPMGRRLILDSLKNFITTYGVDGFRFDLAELLGINVLKEIEAELKKIKPSVILIAEPWSFRGHLGKQIKGTGFAAWNDGFREFMLQYAMGGGNFEGFKYFIGGSMGGFSSFPAQTVNYMESHDDKCMLDRITDRHVHPSAEDLRRYKIAYALILMSHGIPMVAEGFDLVRTKNGKHNTYKDGAANALDYRRGMRFTGEGQWLRNFVKFRRSREARALRPSSPVGEGFFKFFRGDESPAVAVVYNANREMGAARIFAAFNSSDKFAEIPVGDPDADISGCRQIADIDRFDANGIAPGGFEYAHGVLTLPPLSVCVWVE